MVDRCHRHNEEAASDGIVDMPFPKRGFQKRWGRLGLAVVLIGLVAAGYWLYAQRTLGASQPSTRRSETPVVAV